MARIPYVDDSAVASGVVTAPGAAGSIATTAALPKGTYEVRVYTSVSGNAVADLGNFKLLKGGATLVGVLPQGANGQSLECVLPNVSLDTQTLDVQAIGAGTAAIEYAAQIVATRLT